MSRLASLLGVGRPAKIAAIGDMRKGPVVAAGTLTCPTPINSPIRGRSCAGFFYRASHLGWRTVGPATRKPLVNALVYASPLRLLLSDETEVALVPRVLNEFDAEGHTRLAEQDLPGFTAREKLLQVGSEVVVRGKARQRDGEWSILFDQIVPK